MSRADVVVLINHDCHRNRLDDETMIIIVHNELYVISTTDGGAV